MKRKNIKEYHVVDNNNIIENKTGFILKYNFLIGLIFSVLFILMFINFILFHFIVSKNSILTALMTNTCIPSCMIFVIGFFMRNELIQAISVVFIFRYGVLGFFGISLSQLTNYIIENIAKLYPLIIFIQIQHLIMLLSLIYIIFTFIYNNKIKKLFCGIIIGIILLIPLRIYQNNWLNNNPGIISRVFFGKKI